MSNESPEPTVPSKETTAPADQIKTVAAASSSPPATGPENLSTPAPAGTSEGDADSEGQRKPKIQIGARYSTGPRPSGDRPPVGGNRGGDRPPRKDKPRRGGGGPPGKPKTGEGGEGQPAAAEKKPLVIESRRANVPVPSKRDGMTPELEAELNEAFGEMSFDKMVEDGVVSRAVQEVEEETRTRATVMRIDGDNVFLSMGGRNEGMVSLRQLKEPPAVGSEIEVVVKGFNEEEGLYDLIVPGASIDVADWNDLASGVIVEARITGANTGGLECMVNNIRGFIPASQIGLFRVADFAEYINQKLPCVVTEANPRRKNLVLSHRAVLEREKEESRKQLMDSIEPGQIYEGTVRKIQDFGAFVDIGGVDGLVHVSRLSWDRVNHPSEVLQEGQRIKVKVDKVNAETGKISLSYRDLLDRPWDNIEQKFPVGSVVKGTVSRVAQFGAFVKLAPGIEGLIHISELAHGRVRRVEDVLKEGNDVEVKVLSIDPEAQRMALSFKATLPPPEVAAAAKEADAPDEPARPLAVPRRDRPLRGGIDRGDGGNQFGLNW
jgi:predicted RNA-binding protein with RPS1 domain